MKPTCDVAIVGAGPYGLSLAAHLGAAGVTYRIFGKPMQFWQDHVPPRTFLKSDGNSSDLIDPAAALPVSAYYTQRDGSFSLRKPIAVEAFANYGETFQKRFVPALDTRNIAGITQAGGAYRLTTIDGESFAARRVVLAVGINDFRFIPDMFARLGREFVSHSAQFGPVDKLAGRRVAVIGSGASAIDVAAVAHEAGADVTILSSREKIVFHPPPVDPKWHDRFLHPDTGIGAGWSKWLYVNGQDVFRLLPASVRMSIVNRALGPSPGWFMKDRIEGHVPVLSRRVPTGASVDAGHVKIDMPEGPFVADHVVTATGFHVDMNRLAYIDPALRAAIRTVQGAPVLSWNFQTSLPGFYVTGPAAAFNFGPVMRFVYGAGFATPRLATHLIRAATSRANAVTAIQAPELVPAR
jgi:hypothetical protein